MGEHELNPTTSTTPMALYTSLSQTGHFQGRHDNNKHLK